MFFVSRVSVSGRFVFVAVLFLPVFVEKGDRQRGDQREDGVRIQPRLYRVRWQSLRDSRPEDLQDHGSSHAGVFTCPRVFCSTTLPADNVLRACCLMRIYIAINGIDI